MEADVIAIDEVSKITLEQMAFIRSHHDSIVKRAGIGKGMDVASKVFFRLSTALTSSPNVMARVIPAMTI